MNRILAAIRNAILNAAARITQVVDGPEVTRLKERCAQLEKSLSSADMLADQLYYAARFNREWYRRANDRPDCPVPPIDPKGGWTPEQAAAVAAWLASPAGQALWAELQQADQQCMQHAVHGPNDNRDWRCGYAAGFRAANAYLATLSTPAPASGAPEQDDLGAAALLERLAP